MQVETNERTGSLLSRSAACLCKTVLGQLLQMQQVAPCIQRGLHPSSPLIPGQCRRSRAGLHWRTALRCQARIQGGPDCLPCMGGAVSAIVPDDLVAGPPGVAVGKFDKRYKMSPFPVTAACAGCSGRSLARMHRQEAPWGPAGLSVFPASPAKVSRPTIVLCSRMASVFLCKFPLAAALNAIQCLVRAPVCGQAMSRLLIDR